MASPVTIMSESGFVYPRFIFIWILIGTQPAAEKGEIVLTSGEGRDGGRSAAVKTEMAVAINEGSIPERERRKGNERGEREKRWQRGERSREQWFKG